MGTAVLSGGSKQGGLALTAHLHLIPRLRRVEVYLYSSYMPSWRGQGKLCRTFTVYENVRYCCLYEKRSGSDRILLRHVIWIRGWGTCNMTAYVMHTYLWYSCKCKCRTGRFSHIFGNCLLIKSIIIWFVNVVGLEEFNPHWSSNLIAILERYSAYAVHWIRVLAHFAFLLYYCSGRHTDFCVSLVSSYFKYLCFYMRCFWTSCFVWE
jgi:hypothetical protein